MKNLISPVTYLQHQLQSLLGTGFIYHLVSGVIILVVVVLFFKLLKVIIDKFGGSYISVTKTTLDDAILDVVSGSLMTFGIVLAIYLGLQTFSMGVGKGHGKFFTGLTYLNSILYIIAAFVLLRIFIRVAGLILRYSMQRISRHNDVPLDATLAPLFGRILSIAISLVGLIIVLNHFNQNISTLIVSLGVGSLAIALAAQETLSNMIAGFMIMIDRPFRIGDRIKIPSGEEGEVFEIGVRSTKVLDYNNNLLIVPNNELIKTRIINYSYPAGLVRCIVMVGVAYGTDVAKAKEVLLGVAKANPLTLDEPKAEVMLIALGASSLDLRLTAYVDSIKDLFTVTEKLRVGCYNALNAAGIEIPFPQRDVHVRSLPERVNLRPAEKQAAE